MTGHKYYYVFKYLLSTEKYCNFNAEKLDMDLGQYAEKRISI